MTVARIRAIPATAIVFLFRNDFIVQKIHVYPKAIATPTCTSRMTNMIMVNGRWITCQ